MAVFTQTKSGAVNDGDTYGNTSPGVEGTDFPGTGDDCVTANTFNMTFPTTITLGSIHEVTGSTRTAHANGTIITIDSESAGGYSVRLDGASVGIFDIRYTYNGKGLFDGTGTSGSVRNLTVNGGSSAQCAFTPSLTLTGDLSLIAGSSAATMNPNGTGQTLSVGGNLYIASGTLLGRVDWTGAFTVDGSANIEGTYSSAATQVVSIAGGTHIDANATISTALQTVYNKRKTLISMLLEWNMWVNNNVIRRKKK